MLAFLHSSQFGQLWTAHHWLPSAGQVAQEQRDYAKQLAYGLLYGKGPHALAVDLSCDVKKAAKQQESFMQAIPKVVSYTLSLDDTQVYGQECWVDHELLSSHNSWRSLLFLSRETSLILVSFGGLVGGPIAWLHSQGRHAM